MKKSKRLLAFAMSIVMLMGVLFSVNIGATAYPYRKDLPATGTCGASVNYSFDETTGVLTISGTGAMTDNESYSDSIFSNIQSIKEIVIEEGVTTVGAYSFEDCHNVTKVTLPEGLTSIGSRAFAYIGQDGSGIEYINLPSTLETIGIEAFSANDIFRVEYNGTYDALCKLVKADAISQTGNGRLFKSAVIQTTDRTNGAWVDNEDGSKSYKVNDVLLTGTVFDNGKVYYFGDDFKMKTGLLKDVTKVTPVDDSTNYFTYYFDETGAMVHGGWHSDEIGWRYFKVNGEMVFDEFFEMRKSNERGEDLYHFDKDGYMTTGWYKEEFQKSPNPEDIEVEWFYFYPNGIAAREEWLTDSQGWVFMGYYGNMAKNEAVPDTWGLRYVDENGRIIGEGWHYVQDGIGVESYGNLKAPMPEDAHYTWICVDENSYMITERWVTDSFGWLYLNSRGVISIDTIVEDSYGPLYVGIDGHPQANKFIGYRYSVVSLSNRMVRPGRNEIPCFYSGEGGYLTTGWQYVYHEEENVTEWHYFSDNYMMMIDCWVTDSQGWLYLDDMGCISRNTIIEPDRRNGAVYYVNEDGRIDSGWHNILHPWDGQYVWIYADSNGVAYEEGWVQDSQGWCYIDGYTMVKSEWVNKGGCSYYIDDWGHMVTGVYEIDGRSFEFADNGTLVA